MQTAHTVRWGGGGSDIKRGTQFNTFGPVCKKSNVYNSFCLMPCRPRMWFVYYKPRLRSWCFIGQGLGMHVKSVLILQFCSFIGSESRLSRKVCNIFWLRLLSSSLYAECSLLSNRGRVSPCLLANCIDSKGCWLIIQGRRFVYISRPSTQMGETGKYGAYS